MISPLMSEKVNNGDIEATGDYKLKISLQTMIDTSQ